VPVGAPEPESVELSTRMRPLRRVRSALGDAGSMVVGPGTFEAWAVFWIVLLCMLVRAAVLANVFATSGAIFRTNFTIMVAHAVVVAIVAGLLFVAAPRALEWVRPLHDEPAGRARYLLVILIASIATTFTLLFMHRVALVPPIPISIVFRSLANAIAGNFLFALPLLLLTNGIASRFAQRQRRTEVVLRSELALVRTERIALVAADERVRSEIAQALHDDVQTELLRATLRLSNMADALPPERRPEYAMALAEIEHAREYGVRAVGRRLAPPLGTLGLVAALREYCDGFAGVIDVEIAVDEAFRARFLRTEDEDPVAIAIYRTVEQGLQNALKHARARHANLRLSAGPGSEVRVELVTDGEPLAATWQPGLGATVIGTWVDAVGGSWSLRPGDRGGAVLAVTFGR